MLVVHFTQTYIIRDTAVSSEGLENVLTFTKEGNSWVAKLEKAHKNKDYVSQMLNRELSSPEYPPPPPSLATLINVSKKVHP